MIQVVCVTKSLIHDQIIYTYISQIMELRNLNKEKCYGCNYLIGSVAYQFTNH